VRRKTTSGVVAVTPAVPCDVDHLGQPFSEDLQDSQEVDGLTIVNPFLHGPELLDER